MKKYGAALCLALCLAALLTGCGFRPVDELYTLPKLPGDYQNLQTKIEEVTIGTGAEYSAPQWGGYTQPVQFHDLDGDGALEALAFFKVPGEEKPLKIYIFRLTDEGYEVSAVIEGDGTAISSVGYENLNATPAKELVVSWQNSLAVYSVERDEVSELLNTPYTAYEMQDIDMDNRKELLVIHVDKVEGNRSRVDCYAAEKAGLDLVSSAPLSQGVTALDLEAERQGYLKGNLPVPALYITSVLGEGIVTDIFAWKEGALKNVTLNSETGVSNVTSRAKGKANPADINGDTVLELPVPIGQPGGAASTPTMDAWYQYDMDGVGTPVFATYQNFVDGWYFVLPDDWVGKVTVSQDSAAVIGEKRTAFGRWNGEKSETFLIISQLTGPNRHMRNRLGNRFTLLVDDTTIYCAEFIQGVWDSGLNNEGVKERFKLSQTSWPAESAR